MTFSSERKLMLSGWLQENDISSYSKALKLQKFLFFYEGFSKTSGDEYEFRNLKGYQRGPVFSAVWGDYTNDRMEFDEVSKKIYKASDNKIDRDRAMLSDFIVRVFSEEELSRITHKMNIWNSKKTLIEAGILQVELSEDDFSAEDEALLYDLQSAFPIKLISSSDVICVQGKNFVFRKEDAEKLTANHYDTLYAIAQAKDIENPVYVQLDGGVLVVD